MTTNTRIGVFETNSSSSHSITLCLTPSKSMDKIPTNSNGEICIYPGEFGWGPSDHNDAPTKASYCLVAAMSRANNSEESEFATEEELNNPNVQMLERVIKRGTGHDRVMFIPFSSEYHRWGYIDHQSMEVPADLFNDEETMFNFIFNPRSELHVDNDNH